MFCLLVLYKATNIVYKARITSNLKNYKEKIYIGISEGKFKLRYANHKKSFVHQKYQKETELSNEFWKIKELNGEPKVTFSIIKKCHPYEPSSAKCYLCLHEKLYILEYKGDNLLNQRSELVSKCRHKNKYKLCNHKLKS